MKSLQDNLSYYERQKQEIIKNKQSYQTAYYHTDYGPWQSASYTFSWQEILGEVGYGFFYSVFWKADRYGQHMRGDSASQNSIRHTIARKLGRQLDEISPNLCISARGNLPTYQIDDRAYFSSYTVGYQHSVLPPYN